MLEYVVLHCLIKLEYAVKIYYKKCNSQFVNFIPHYQTALQIRSRKMLQEYKGKGKGKVIPLQARCGPEGG